MIAIYDFLKIYFHKWHFHLSEQGARYCKDTGKKFHLWEKADWD